MVVTVHWSFPHTFAPSTQPWWDWLVSLCRQTPRTDGQQLSPMLGRQRFLPRVTFTERAALCICVLACCITSVIRGSCPGPQTVQSFRSVEVGGRFLYLWEIHFLEERAQIRSFCQSFKGLWPPKRSPELQTVMILSGRPLKRLEIQPLLENEAQICILHAVLYET